MAAKTMKEKARAMLASFSSSVADWLVDWSFVLNFVSLLLVGLTVILGGLTIIAGKIDGDRKDAALAKLEGANIQSQKELETMRKDNLQLSLKVAFRDIRPQFSASLPKLKSFGRIEIELSSTKDAEPMWVAYQIGDSLLSVDWVITKSDQSLSPHASSGITVFASKSTVESDRAEQAANALVTLLKECGANAVALIGGPSHPNMIRVSVGPSDKTSSPKMVIVGDNGQTLIDPLEHFDPAMLPSLTNPKWKQANDTQNNATNAK